MRVFSSSSIKVFSRNGGLNFSLFHSSNMPVREMLLTLMSKAKGLPKVRATIFISSGADTLVAGGVKVRLCGTRAFPIID